MGAHMSMDRKQKKAILEMAEKERLAAAANDSNSKREKLLPDRDEQKSTGKIRG